ncbi:MAG TPA: hypothetical protein PKJ41_16820 [Bryobacteraceae bacterium]|nr:hypothetical protein [Bryobacteraceae bacterium]HPT27256.1 hypothetical protein [Bryobacteraceae bacterium]
MKYDLKDAVPHIVHDCAYLFASGTDTQQPHPHPFNHYAERTFLVHYRTMVEFFAGRQDVRADHFTRGDFKPSLNTWERWEPHIQSHLMHLTAGRTKKERRRTWDGTTNKLMLDEFRATWAKFLGELRDDLKPIFEREMEKQRANFKGYVL